MPDDFIMAMGGTAGMAALMTAFERKQAEFDLLVVAATPIDGSRGLMLLLTIDETTAALTIAEVRMLSTLLIDGSREAGLPASGDIERFGRVLARLLEEVLEEVPGQHRLH